MKANFMQLLINIGFVVAFIFGFALIVTLIWNAGMTWLIHVDPMTYWNALGLSLLGVLIHIIVNFWINRYLAIKKIKYLKGIDLVEDLQLEVMLIKIALLEKNILE